MLSCGVGHKLKTSGKDVYKQAQPNPRTHRAENNTVSFGISNCGWSRVLCVWRQVVCPGYELPRSWETGSGRPPGCGWAMRVRPHGPHPCGAWLITISKLLLLFTCIELGGLETDQLAVLHASDVLLRCGNIIYVVCYQFLPGDGKRAEGCV